MIIREGDDWVEIEAVDRVPDNLPSAGDVELSVAVSSAGFAGQGSAWVAAPALAAFLVEFRDLEARRQGAATLEGLSPEQFRLRIWSVNRRGHVAVGGLVAKHIHRGEGGPYRHQVEFGFEFDATLLPKLLSGFQAIANSGGYEAHATDA
jgi:hypothetical protein